MTNSHIHLYDEKYKYVNILSCNLQRYNSKNFIIHHTQILQFSIMEILNNHGILINTFSCNL